MLTAERFPPTTRDQIIRLTQMRLSLKKKEIFAHSVFTFCGESDAGHWTSAYIRNLLTH